MSDLEKHLDQLLELAKSAWHDERFAAAAELRSLIEAVESLQDEIAELKRSISAYPTGLAASAAS